MYLIKLFKGVTISDSNKTFSLISFDKDSSKYLIIIFIFFSNEDINFNLYKEFIGIFTLE